MSENVENDHVVQLPPSVVDAIDSSKPVHSSGVQVKFLKFLKEGNPKGLLDLIWEQEISKLDINYIYTEYEDLNAFQLICLEINERHAKDPTYPEKKEDFMQCIQILFDKGIDLAYKEPFNYFEGLDFSLFTYDKDIISRTLEQYKNQNISVANKDILTTVIYIYEDIIRGDNLDYFLNESDDSESIYTEEEYEKAIKNDGVGSELESSPRSENLDNEAPRRKKMSTTSSKYSVTEPDDIDECVEIIKILLEAGVGINTLDVDSGVPPIYLAAKLRSRKIVNLLLGEHSDNFNEKIPDQNLEYIDGDNTNADLDLDNYVDVDNETARILIVRYELIDGRHFLPDPDKFKFHIYYQLILEKNFREFIKTYNKPNEKEEFSDDQKYAFLLRAIQQGATEIVSYMLRDTADVKRDFETMLRIACAKGYFNIVKILFDYIEKSKNGRFSFQGSVPFNKKEINYEISLIKLLVDKGIENMETQISDVSVDYNKCLELLLKHKNNVWNHKNLNKIDHNGKSILEYAIQRNQETMVQILLKYNTSLVVNDAQNTCLALEIDPQLLLKHFNDCITTQKSETLLNKNKKRITSNKTKKASSKEKFNYSIDFNSILPPRNGLNKNVVEMMVLEEIARDPDYNEVLLHPLCQIFTSLKWHKIRYFFHIDAIFYLVYALIVSFYVFFENGFYPRAGFFILLYLSAFGLLIWEILQISVFLRIYFVVFESWTKLILLILSLVLIILHHVGVQERYILIQIHSSLILVSYINFFFLMGHLPLVPSRVITSIVMLKTVYFSFVPSFLTYLPLLFAFITSYYLLFPGNPYFSHYPTAIFKTILMATGDLDTDNLNLQGLLVTYPLILLFLLFISIGLLNLLTGLAVSDIQNIKDNSEIFSLKIRIQQISRIENIVFKHRWVDSFPILKNWILLFYDPDIRRTIRVDESYALFYRRGKDSKNDKSEKISGKTGVDGQSYIHRIRLRNKILNILRMKRKMFNTK